MDTVDAFVSSLNENDPFRREILASISTVEDAIDKYGTRSLVLSFNGGKDACVIFHLVRYGP